MAPYLQSITNSVFKYWPRYVYATTMLLDETIYPGGISCLGGLSPVAWWIPRAALQHAASIAGLLLTTECLITEAPEKAASQEYKDRKAMKSPEIENIVVDEVHELTYVVMAHKVLNDGELYSAIRVELLKRRSFPAKGERLVITAPKVR